MNINLFLISTLSISIAKSSLLSPPNQSTLNRIHVLFEWEQYPEANSYQIQISKDINFDEILVDNNVYSLLYIDVDNINWDDSYFWRISPKKNLEPIGEWSSVFSFLTSQSISEVETIIYDANQVNPGLTIFGSFFNYFSAVLDPEGKEIWNSGLDDLVYYGTSRYGDKFGCYFLPGTEHNFPGIEFSFEQGTIWSEPNENFVHHDIIQLPNGNYMGIVEESTLGVIPIGGWTSSFQDLGFQADGSEIEFPWIGDRIVEWDEDTKEIIWSWSVFDHFSMDDYDEYGGTWNQAFIDLQYDWTHVNAVIFDEDESAIYISTRHLSRISKIDYPSGEVIWNIGHQMNSDDIDMGSDIGFSFQHSLQKLGNGNILTLDNGNLSPQFRGIDEFITRAIEIEITENTASLGWSYELHPDLFGFASGNVQKLENSNVLITTIGGSGKSLEVTESGDIVWEAQYNLGLPNGAVYRADRIKGLYPAAFSVIIDNYLEYNGQIGVHTPEGNSSISFHLKHEGSVAQKFNYFLEDQEGWFDDVQGNVYLEPGENHNLLFFGLIPENSSSSSISLTVWPHYHPENEKIIVLEAFTSPLSSTVSNSPSQFEFKLPYPNPFNGTVNFDFSLMSSSHVLVQIFNLKGHLIDKLIDKKLTSGVHSLKWDATEKSAGVYFVRISTKQSDNIQKIIYLK